MCRRWTNETKLWLCRLPRTRSPAVHLNVAVHQEINESVSYVLETLIWRVNVLLHVSATIMLLLGYQKVLYMGLCFVVTSLQMCFSGLYPDTITGRVSLHRNTINWSQFVFMIFIHWTSYHSSRLQSAVKACKDDNANETGDVRCGYMQSTLTLPLTSTLTEIMS
jgi:hypothetical protein